MPKRGRGWLQALQSQEHVWSDRQVEPLTLTEGAGLISDQNIPRDKPLLMGKWICKRCTQNRPALAQLRGLGVRGDICPSQQIPTSHPERENLVELGLFKCKVQSMNKPMNKTGPAACRVLTTLTSPKTGGPKRSVTAPPSAQCCVCLYLAVICV